MLLNLKVIILAGNLSLFRQQPSQILIQQEARMLSYLTTLSLSTITKEASESGSEQWLLFIKTQPVIVWVALLKRGCQWKIQVLPDRLALSWNSSELRWGHSACWSTHLHRGAWHHCLAGARAMPWRGTPRPGRFRHRRCYQTWPSCHTRHFHWTVSRFLGSIK